MVRLILELEGVEACVEAIGEGEQGVVSAAFDDAPLIEHVDHVGVADGS
ncbi:MAG: hypothetical protein KIT00_04905 [Rhodospirillales bacterium]|nr:hypothetical protein [Rhodospirillales bacterium]